MVKLGAPDNMKHVTNTEESLLASVEEAITSLLRYCQDNDWAGYDPYDALNSKVFRSTLFFRSKFCRIAFTQVMKRTPVNFRPLLAVAKEQNPKALALFAAALLKLPDRRPEASEVVDLLIKSRSTRHRYACWGYNFDWQNRVTFVPRGEPNIICTTFAGNALLDAYEKHHNEEHLAIALSASEFLLHGLNITKSGDEICFSYTSRDYERVHNANLLGAAFLTRLYRHTRDERLLAYALSAAKFSINRQAPDGSWPYGEGPSQGWIDNFHTGSNLVALRRIAAITDSSECNRSLREGFEFYRKHFLQEGGVVQYYHNRTYPIDLHAIAQSIITLVELRDLQDDSLALALNVFQYARQHMRDPSGYFYFQKGRFITNKSAYMRWCQAWMLLALTVLADGSQAALDRDSVLPRVQLMKSGIS